MSSKDESTIRDILDAFEGPIQKVKVSFSYQLSLLFVAAAMVMLPLLYLALVALAGYGVFWHVTENTSFLEHGKWGFFLYALVVAVGAILVFFMIKPLLARPAKGPDPFKVNRNEQPHLFALVEKICDTISAPYPHEIVISCDVNASAGLRRGFRSFLANDLVLTIGTPLAAGFTIRQLVGVLAHEFGHFSQGAAMRFGYVIILINRWFARLVYERDEWDMKLRDYSKTSDLGLVFYVARFAVWLTRRILWALMMLGHFISSALRRQQEFDADRYESRVAGADSFRSAFERLHLLAVASNGAHSDLSDMWTEKRLGDDFAGLVLANLEQIPSDIQERILADTWEEKTGFFDSHPSFRSRVESVDKESPAGVFQIEAPATAIFEDFESLSKQATKEYFRSLLGDQFDASELISTDEVVAKQAALSKDRNALHRFVQGFYHVYNPPELSPEATRKIAGNDEAKELTASLKQYRQEIENGRRDVTSLFERVRKRYKVAHELDISQELAASGLSFKAKDLGIEKTDVVSIREAKDQAYEELDASWATIALMDSIRGRYVSGLRVAQTSAGKRALEAEGFDPAQISGLVNSALTLREALPIVNDLRLDNAMFGRLYDEWDDDRENDRMAGGLRRVQKRIHRRLVELREMLVDAYPLEHSQEDLTTGAFIIPYLPADNETGELLEASDRTSENFTELYTRILGRLAIFVETVEEKLLKLKPLADPKDEN